MFLIQALNVCVGLPKLCLGNCMMNVDMCGQTDRHNCFTSGNILKAEAGHIYLIFVTAL